MKILVIRFLPFASMLFSILLAASGQNSTQQIEPAETAVDADSLALQPFETTNITEAFSLSGNLILDAGRKNFTDEDLTVYASEVDSLQQAIIQLGGDSILANLAEIDVKELNLTIEGVDYLLGLLQELQDQLSVKATELK